MADVEPAAAQSDTMEAVNNAADVADSLERVRERHAKSVDELSDVQQIARYLELQALVSDEEGEAKDWPALPPTSSFLVSQDISTTRRSWALGRIVCCETQLTNSSSRSVTRSGGKTTRR